METYAYLDLKSLEEKNNFYNELQNGVKVEKSHLLLDSYKGGKLYIPHEKEYEFFKMYIEDYNNKIKLYVVEVRTEIFKFMIDLDIGATLYWTDENVINISKIINTIVNQFYK